MVQNNFDNIVLIKIIRALILYIGLYFVIKYFTIGKIPYNEINMICSTGILIQTILDIYRPIIVINEDTT